MGVFDYALNPDEQFNEAYKDAMSMSNKELLHILELDFIPPKKRLLMGEEFENLPKDKQQQAMNGTFDDSARRAGFMKAAKERGLGIPKKSVSWLD